LRLFKFARSPLREVIAVDAYPQKPQSAAPTTFARGCTQLSKKVIHAWIGHWIYGDIPLFSIFMTKLLFGLVAFVLQLPFSIWKDMKRIKQLRYGRRLQVRFL